MIRRRIVVVSIIVVFLTLLASFSGLPAQETKKSIITSSITADSEFTLFAPMKSTVTYLINKNGDVVNSWPSDHRPEYSVYLLDNRTILRTQQVSIGGLSGGGVQKIDSSGAVLWDFPYVSARYRQHHDIELLPNGNVLLLSHDIKDTEEAIAAGRNPELLTPGGVWCEKVVEVRPNGTTGGDIVWEWRLWDHLIQDFDPSKDNYGIVVDHPELLDINFGVRGYPDWLHANTVTYNPELDQIIICFRHISEFFIIDHSTTTEEARGHTGGRYGRGGDILYRWGNPQVYRAGDAEDQTLFKPHDAQWIEPDRLGEGHILIFNNGVDRPGGDYSSVDEIIPPVDATGNYTLVPGSAFGPAEPVWVYTAENPTSFYSGVISGCQRLPNGNTLICNGTHGYFFEVTPEKEVVWEYKNHFPNPYGENEVFKVRRYYTLPTPQVPASFE